MKSLYRYLFLLILISLFPGSLSAQPCTEDGITSEEYMRRRNALIDLVDTSSVIIIHAMESNSEYEYLNYRQDLNFLYLTGVENPGYTLLIVPRGLDINGKKWKSILFAPSFFLESSSGFSGTRIPHKEYHGSADTVVPALELRQIMRKAIPGSRTLYYTAPGFSFLHDWLNDRPVFLDKEIQKILKQTYSGLRLSKAATLVNRLRQVKSPEEIDLIRKAVSITGEGIERAMRVCKPDIREYELQAEIEYSFIRNGAKRAAFRSIIGAGVNSLSPHYDDNDCQAEAGEVVVMDVGAEYQGYTADITRTIPISGKFTEEQKIIYETVLQAQKQLIAMVRPGITYADIDKKATRLFSDAGYPRYILHGVTHPIGLDVHDVQTMQTLEPGMVITIEPGLYIPEGDTILSKGFRGFGIRIEDDILVTGDGFEVLSAEIPKEMSDIERLMRQ